MVHSVAIIKRIVYYVQKDSTVCFLVIQKLILSHNLHVEERDKDGLQKFLNRLQKRVISVFLATVLVFKV